MRRSSRTLFCALTLLSALTGCADEAVETIQQGETNGCAAEQKTIEIAVETYYANGAAPGSASMEVLVGFGLLRAASSTHVVEGGTNVVAIPGGPCDPGGGAGAPTAAPALSPEQCEADRATLQGAVDAFGAAYSISPMDESELVRAKLLLSEVQGYDLQGSTLVPVAGSCA